MVRRRYPFYRPVHHRTADKVRNSVASWGHGWISWFWKAFMLWISIFLIFQFFYYINDVPAEFTFNDYATFTWDIIYPVFVLIGDFIKTLIQ